MNSNEYSVIRKNVIFEISTNFQSTVDCISEGYRPETCNL